jgi:selenide,water dikinase
MDECLATITTLNKTAAEIMQGFKVHAATDVTGFGLAGHAFEMAAGSDVRLKISMDEIPIMQEALAMYKKGMNTGMNASNRRLVAENLRFENKLPAWHQEIVYDPQTSGGLLVSVPASGSENMLEALINAGVDQARIIGHVTERQDEICLVFR